MCAKLKYYLLVLAIIFTGTSCSMVKNNNKLITEDHSAWISFNASPQYKYYFDNNNYIGVTTPELYEEVITFGPLVFPIIPIYHNQYIKQPYNINILTSYKDTNIDLLAVKVYVNNTLYNHEVKDIYIKNDLDKNIKKYISIDMASSDINNIKLVFPAIQHNGNIFDIPELPLSLNQELNFEFGFIN